MPIKIIPGTGDEGSQPTVTTPEAAASQNVFSAAPGRFATGVNATRSPAEAAATLAASIPAAKQAATDALPTAAALGASLLVPESIPVAWGARILAAGIAGGAAEPLRRTANHLLGIQTELDNKPLGEAIQQQATKQAEMQALGEAFGAVLHPVLNVGVKAFNRIIKPLGSAVEDASTQAVRETAEAYLGKTLTAGEIANNPALKAVQQAMERRATATPLSRARDLQIYQRGMSAVNDALDMIGPQAPISELGEAASAGKIVQNAFDAADAAWSSARRDMWAAIKQKGVNVPVDISPVRNLATEIMTPQTEAQQAFSSLLSPGAPVKRALRQLGENTQSKLMAQMEGLSPQAKEQILSGLGQEAKGITSVNLPDAIDINSALQDTMRKLDPHSKDFQKLASVQGEMYSAMEKATKSAGLYDDWRSAADFTRDGHALFQSSVLRNAARQNPESVVAGIDLKSPSDIANARTAIVDHAGDTDAWKILQRYVLKDKIIGPVGKDGMVDLAGVSARLRAADPAAINLLAKGSPDTDLAISQIKAVGDAIERKAKAPSPNQPVYQFTSDANQALNLVAKVALGKLVGVPVAVASRIMPEAVLKTMYSPKATAYLLDGIKILGTQPQLPLTTTRGIAAVARAFEVVHEALPEADRKRNETVPVRPGGIQILPMGGQVAAP